MTGKWKKVLFVALLGALGGAINAWLWLPHNQQNPIMHFPWTMVPAGALHGAILALIPGLAALAIPTRQPVSRFLLAPPLGWVAGYLSWIPLDWCASDTPWSDVLLWPFRTSPALATAYAPFLLFGLVSVIYFLCLSFGGLQKGRVLHMACGACAGVGGSLWFWMDWGHEYNALIHGTIWGVLVGWGMHTVTKPHSHQGRETGGGSESL